MSIVPILDETAADRRGEARPAAVLRVARLIAEAGDQLCVVRNISPTGLMASADKPPARDARVAMEFSTDVTALGVVRWVSAGRFGVEFDRETEILSALHRPASRLRRRKTRAPRFARSTPVRVETPRRTFDADLLNISLNGMHIATDESDLEPLLRFSIRIAGLPDLAGQIRWVGNGTMGIWFERALAYRDLAAWLTQRERRAGA